MFSNRIREVLKTATLVVAVLLSVNPANADPKLEDRPNILVAISDDQSFPHASAYGAGFVDTPAFDRVAREGVLFMNAFVASPGCSPSRAAMLTGRYPWQIEHAGTHASSFPRKFAVFPELLAEAGYFTGHTGKGWGPGNWEETGWPSNPAGPAFEERSMEPPHGGISSVDYAGNFSAFLAERPDDQPFLFWYGAHEPHLVYEEGVGRRLGKQWEDVDVPSYLPDVPAVRGNMLDYAVEIEWFDQHLAHMLRTLEAAGELDNTIVIVTSDNGMPLPRAKANVFEDGIHVPLAVRWGSRAPGGRTVDDLVSLVDIMPTLLEATGVEHPGPYSPSGRSFLNILTSAEEGRVDPARDAVFSARERHSSSRYNSLSYPQRAVRTERYLYIRNFEPQRWPAGAPQKYNEDGTLEANHQAYHDIDASESKTFLINHRDDPAVAPYFELAVQKRPAEELYDVRSDPGCIENLAEDPTFAEVKKRLAARLNAFLEETGDPRARGEGDIFDTYRRYSHLRKFPVPDWARSQGDAYRPEWLPPREANY